MKEQPKVSVLMPVYNAGAFLAEAMESVLRQSFSDFEFLIINDGSTDNSTEVIKRFRDPRIKPVQLDANAGIINALNVGLSLVRGKYIARMDADDIATKERFADQVGFMDGHPEIGVCGSWVEYFGNRTATMKAPVSHEEITWTMLFGSPFFHPSVMMRADLFKNGGAGYPTDFPHAEDYALWIALVGRTRFANLPKVLLKYRFFENSISATHKMVQLNMGAVLCREIHAKLLGRALSDSEWDGINEQSKNLLSVKSIAGIYNEINRNNSLFPDNLFRKKMTTRIKQLMMKRKVDKASYYWLVENSAEDFALLKYIIRSAIK